MALALRYSTDVGTLRRLNNLPLSELSVQSRAKVYIPGELRSPLLFMMHRKGGRWMFTIAQDKQLGCNVHVIFIECPPGASVNGSTLPFTCGRYSL